jgi:hypothetical protein
MHDPDESEEINDDAAEESSASHRQPLRDDLRSVEAALARLRPRADELNRDRFLFLAGQASVAENGARSPRDRFLHWYWPASSVGMTGVAAALLIAQVMRSDPPTVEKLVYVAAGPSAQMSGARMEIDRVTGQTDATDFPSAPPGVWTVKHRFRLTDDLLGPESLAQATAAISEFQPAAGAEPAILSSRSFKKLLEESNEYRGAADRPRSPAAHSPGAQSGGGAVSCP